MTVPSPVTIPAGALQPTQAIAISVGNPGAGVTQIYTLTANVILASGNIFPLTATLTVTGHAPGLTPILRSPVSPILSSGGALSANVASPAANPAPGAPSQASATPDAARVPPQASPARPN